MVLSDISVKRPVFATVISLLLVAFGILAFQQLPLREYPDISPPIVTVRISYPGASADIIESEITEIVEDRISGIEGIRTISSSSREGVANITIEFNLSRDIDAAANDVRERVSRIVDNMPDEADPPEIFKADSDAQAIMWFNLSSSIMNEMELTDFAERFVMDELTVVDGVAQIRVGGGRRFAMRIWLDRRAMAARGITVQDIEGALRSENVELPAGRIESLQREFTVRVERNFRTPSDFAGLVIKRGEDGHLVRMSEVATVAIGPESDRNEFRGNGQSQVGIGIVKQSTANTLEVARGVNQRVAQIRETLPDSVTLHDSVDNSVFIEAAISQVYRTLTIAMGLVIFIIYLFLGNLRATLIPAITVPVCLTASFIVTSLFGYSINLMTLLALVLAIGLVVDDSIVVLENIYRRIENGEAPLVAAYRGARQVAFAVISTTLVLIAVFVPIAFLGGSIGRMFAELATAVAAAVAFSSIVALSLAPMLCSKILHAEKKHNWLNRKVDNAFNRLSQGYQRALKACLPHSLLMGFVLFAVLASIVGIMKVVPKEFTPAEDRGVFFVFVEGPVGSSFEYTQRQMRIFEDRLLEIVESGEAIRIMARIPGFGGSGDEVNRGLFVVVMAPWGERERSSQDVMNELFKDFKGEPGARAFPVMRQGLGFGARKPLQFVIGGTSYDELVRWRDIILEKAAQNPGLLGVDSDYKETKPLLMVSINRDRAADLGVSIRTIGLTLETMMNSRRVTTYKDRGEEYDVILQSSDDDRRQPSDLTNIYVRSETTGTLIPLSNFITFENRADASSLNRFNRMRSITISANLAPGYALGDALAFLEQTVADNLSGNVKIDYKGQSREFQDSSQSLYFTFALALLVVFLVLSAQFESFVHPIVIMLTVPLAVTGALLGLLLTGGTLNVYSQIGIIMLIGIAAKNGILIVEFANQLRDAGRSIEDALMEAAQIRLRPILMTAFSTAMGAIPLIMASGAGEASLKTVGVVIFSGVIFATFLTVFMVPVFYVALAKYTKSPGAVAEELQELMGQGPAE